MSQITLSHGDLHAVIDYHGAELKSLSKNGKEYMWNADPAYWNRTSPVLFPFVGAVANKEYRYKGMSYPMGQHGFARDMDFKLVSSSSDRCSFVLHSSEDTLKKYPFEFELTISYELSDTGIEVIWDVKNPAEEPLLFSIGAHPAFNCVLDATRICIKNSGTPLDSFINSVFGQGLLTQDKKEIKLDNGIMSLNSHSFDGDAFVIENSQADQVDVMDNEGNTLLSVAFTSPLVGIWSPPGKNAPFLCIEPWYGRADKEGFCGELADREWNNTLFSGESFHASYRIIV